MNPDNLNLTPVDFRTLLEVKKLWQWVEAKTPLDQQVCISN